MGIIGKTFVAVVFGGGACWVAGVVIALFGAMIHDVWTGVATRTPDPNDIRLLWVHTIHRANYIAVVIWLFFAALIAHLDYKDQQRYR